MITANVSKMFATIEPCYVSGSRAELGDAAGRITWDNAMNIAGQCPRWLVSPLNDAADESNHWARETGAWDRDEIEAWSTQTSLALFVQNIASELRMLGSDDLSLDECVGRYNATDWDEESEYPSGYYYIENGDVFVQWSAC